MDATNRQNTEKINTTRIKIIISSAYVSDKFDKDSTREFSFHFRKRLNVRLSDKRFSLSLRSRFGLSVKRMMCEYEK